MIVDSCIFPMEYQKNHWRFWLKREFPEEMVLSVAEALAEDGNINGRTFKDDEFRHVYQAEHYPQILVKVNKLPRLKDRLRPWRAAQWEMNSHLLAEASGVKCPRLLGGFEKKNCFGLVQKNGLLVEYLDGWHELSPEEFLPAVIVLNNLYECGVNHPDFMRRNVMVKNDDSKEAMIIDLEGCSFVGKHNPAALLMQTSRFIEYNEQGFEHENSQQFLNSVAEMIIPHVDKEQFFSSVRFLLSCHRSRYERRNLILPPECILW